MAWSKESRQARGLGADWDKARIRALRRDFGMCQLCAKADRDTPATEVDHIIPRSKGGTHDLANLQSLCHECHAEKSAADLGKRYRPRPQIGPDGYPIQMR
jgi:5-methylcytosine-specific restriction protein A